jgi:hypothetical protein
VGVGTLASASGLLVIERILRDRQGVWRQLVEDRDLPRLVGQMLASTVLALAVYGAVLGSFHSAAMAGTSAVKLPLLFLATLAICLPTLYLFNLVFGARLSVRQSLALVMVALTVTAMLALAFAPISLFFLITAPNYQFFKLLNVAILALSALVGLRFMTDGMRVLNQHGLLAPAAPAPTPAAADPVAVPAEEKVPAAVGAGNGATPAALPAPQQVQVPLGYVLQPIQRPVPAKAAGGQTPPSMTLLYIWILLFGFVGTQLAWTLRPFFGSPGKPFSLYREIDGNFYAEIFKTISHLF